MPRPLTILRDERGEFTMLGARLFLDIALDELTNRAIALDDVFGRAAGTLTGALHDAPTWDARFDLLDRTIAGRMNESRPVAPEPRHRNRDG